MSNELPSNVSHGTVVGRYILAYADSSDVDLYPDGVPASGNIFFTPLVEKLRNSSGTPAPVTIIPAQVVASLNEEGYIVGPDGTAGIRLLATDDPDNSPVNWVWQVDYRLLDENGGILRGVASHEMSLPGGTTVNLISIAPVAGLVG